MSRWLRAHADAVRGLYEELKKLPENERDGHAIRIAAAEGMSVVRWITADDNYRARTAYDRVATRTVNVLPTLSFRGPGAVRPCAYSAS